MAGAAAALQRGLCTAAATIVAVPVAEYERTGDAGGAAVAVVRAVPVAILRPMIGAAEAMTSLLYGVRNTMDEEGREDDKMKWKSNREMRRAERRRARRVANAAAAETRRRKREEEEEAAEEERRARRRRKRRGGRYSSL